MDWVGRSGQVTAKSESNAMNSLGPRYRLYIDETGNPHTSQRSIQTGERFLGMTGVIVECGRYSNRFSPTFEELKQKHFGPNHGRPIILHRDDIIKKRGPFSVLTCPDRRRAWGEDFIEFAKTQRYRLLTVVIDKQDHIARHGHNAKHPYHYCTEAMLERYCLYLKNQRGFGDAIAESRGKREDKALKFAWSFWYRNGTDEVPSEIINSVLTTRDIKLSRKDDNVNGIQMADLLAHSLKTEVLIDRSLIPKWPEPFGPRLCQAVRDKHDLHPVTGLIEGYGRKFLG